MKNIEKLIIVGNGFDLSHGLHTSYKNFSEAFKSDEVLNKFEMLVTEVEGKDKPSDTWYYFENVIENITRIVFTKTVESPIKDRVMCDYDNEMKEFNLLFAKVKKLLIEYLISETKNKPIKKKESLVKEFECHNTYAISFNYTNTVNYYTDCVEYIHGSLLNDLDVVLGFANDIPPMDLASGVYIEYSKAVQKFILKYLRFLQANDDVKNIKDRLNELQPHIYSLFSGKGGWDFPIVSNNDDMIRYDLTGVSNSLAKFYEQNKSLEPFVLPNYKDVREIVIAGHGLESDLPFFQTLMDSTENVTKVVLYTYNMETTEDRQRKISVLKKWFHVDNVVLKYYD